MKTFFAIVVAGVLTLGSAPVQAQAVFESLLDDETPSRTTFLTPIEALSRTTTSFSIVRVSAADAQFLQFDVPLEAVRARIAQNRFAARFVANAGYRIDQVVGARADDRNSVTLFVVG